MEFRYPVAFPLVLHIVIAPHQLDVSGMARIRPSHNLLPQFDFLRLNRSVLQL